MSHRSFSLLSVSSQLPRVHPSSEPRERIRDCERLLQNTLQKYDVDNSGTIDRQEFKELLTHLKVHERLDAVCLDDVVDALLVKLDKNKNGEIEIKEFAEFISEQEVEHVQINREKRRKAASLQGVEEHMHCIKIWKNFAEGLYLLVEAEELKCDKKSLLFRIHKAAGFIILWALFLNSFLSVFVFIASTSPSQSFQPSSCPAPACNNDSSLCPGIEICKPIPLPVFNQINFVIEIIFTCDFSIRLLTVWAVCSRTAKLLALDWKLTHTDIQAIPQYSTTEQYFRFLGSFRSLIDMAIIIPYWIESTIQPDYTPICFLRVFALFRMFRLLSFTNKYHRFDNAAKILILTVWNSSTALLIMLLCCGVFMIFFGSIMFIIESGTFQVTESYPQGAYLVDTYTSGAVPTSYNSIPASMYFVSTTLTTVGYGDIVPISTPGRFVACVIMFCGCLFISLPIAIVSAEFKRVFDQYMATEKLDILVQEAINASAQLPEVEQEILKETIQDNFDAIDEESDLTPYSRAYTKERVLEEIEEISKQGSSIPSQSRRPSYGNLDHDHQLPAHASSRPHITLSREFSSNDVSEESYKNNPVRRRSRINATIPNTEVKDLSDISCVFELTQLSPHDEFRRSGLHVDFSNVKNEIPPPRSDCMKAPPDIAWNQNTARKGSSFDDVDKYPSSTKHGGPTLNSQEYYQPQHHSLSTIPEQLSSMDLLPHSKLVDNEVSKTNISIFERVYDIFNCEGIIEDNSLFWNTLNIIGLIVIYSTILVGVGSFIIATVPSMQYSPSNCSNPACNDDPYLCPGQVICEPQPLDAFVQVDKIFIIIFSVDYLVRFFLCWSVHPGKNFVTKYFWELPVPDSRVGQTDTEVVSSKTATPQKTTLGFENNPKFSKLEFYVRYIISIRSIVDLACIVPAYPAYFGISSFGSTWVRAFRVLRIFKLILVNQSMRDIISMVGSAFWMSFDALVMFFLVVVSGAVVFGTIIYYIEIGNFAVTAEYPNGVFFVPSVNGFSEQQSLFGSVSVGLYYTFTTLTTVGYGDVTPTTYLGRFLAVFIQYTGVLLLALPVGIMGANFTAVYDDFQAKHIFLTKLKTLLKSFVSQLPLNQQRSSKSSDLIIHPQKTSKNIYEDFNENDSFHT